MARSAERRREYDKKYHLRNKERRNARSLSWDRDNPSRAYARKALASARKRGAAIPEGITSKEALALTLPIYAAAHTLTEQTGLQWEVDHEVPCHSGGEHHPFNLRIVTRTYNRHRQLGSKVADPIGEAF